MSITSIEWTDRSVNPIRARLGAAVGHHCEKVSPGCANCYASRLQSRFKMPPFQMDKRADVEPFFDERRLQEVLRRKTPTKWFWCDMSDMFGRSGGFSEPLGRLSTLGLVVSQQRGVVAASRALFLDGAR